MRLIQWESKPMFRKVYTSKRIANRATRRVIRTMLRQRTSK